jgi:DNA-directed RNA polymerase II subunit RPB2
MVKQSNSEQYHDRQKQIRRVFSDDDHFLKGLYFVQNDVLPHIGNRAEDRNLKGYHVGYMVSQLIKAYLGHIPCDDRDHLLCKRFDMAGPLIGSLIKKLVLLIHLHSHAKFLINFCRLLASYLNRIMRLLTLKLDNKRNFDIFTIAESTSITAGLIYGFSSGNWGEKSNSSTARQGVSQVCFQYHFKFLFY